MPKVKSRKYNSRFQKEWLTIEKYKLWLEAVPSDGGRALFSLFQSFSSNSFQDKTRKNLFSNKYLKMLVFE